MSLFQRKPVSDKESAGKGGPQGQSDLDRRINWAGMRDSTTVTGPTSRKPQTMAPFWDVGVSRGSQDQRHNKGAPLENYWGKQFAVPSSIQYLRSWQDHTPTVQRRYDSGAVSGIANVQLINPVATTSRKRIVLYTAAGYLWAVAPRIPGQTRDNFGGFHMRGIDPQSYAAMVAAGPGSNPVNPGGPGKIAGKSYVNPMHTGVGGVMNT